MDATSGEFLVRLARKAIFEYLAGGVVIQPPKDADARYLEKRGVFVTLHTHPAGSLRGCIGFAEPIKPLAAAVIESAVSAATGDPRFPPLTLDELAATVIEVTVLTPPERVIARDPDDYLRQIEVGRHGLIIEKGLCRGLLLPQVPDEQSWSCEEFLAGLCMKAGLPESAWKDGITRLYRFEGVIFSETEPGGVVVEKGI
jgi:uncharacterized protein